METVDVGDKVLKVETFDDLRFVVESGGLAELHSLQFEGAPLPLKQLMGKEPVESLDLSDRELGVASARAIASLLESNTVTTSLKYAAASYVPLLSAPSDTPISPLFAVCASTNSMLRLPSTLRSASRITRPSPRSSMPPIICFPTVSTP